MRGEGAMHGKLPRTKIEVEVMLSIMLCGATGRVCGGRIQILCRAGRELAEATRLHAGGQVRNNWINTRGLPIKPTDRRGTIAEVSVAGSSLNQ